MADQKTLRMDEAGPRLARIVADLRALQEKLHNEKLGRLIEELASVATMALSWHVLAEMNGIELPGDEEKTS